MAKSITHKDIDQAEINLQLLVWYLDPSQFYRDLYKEEPYYYQELFFKDVQKLNRMMLLSAAGIGKTKLLSCVALWLSIVYASIKKKKYDVLILSGSKKQATKLYEYSSEPLQNHPILSKFVKGEILTQSVKFTNGSTVRALPKSLKSIQGEHVNCFDDKTEVLTANGFKLFKDITSEDYIATLNQNTHKLEYQLPTDKICKPFKGSLVKLENKYIDIMCTEDHNLYIKTQWKDWHLHPAKLHDLPFRFYIKKDCEWDGNKECYYTLPSFYEPYRKHIYEEQKLPMKTWLKFLGYFLAEGWTEFNKGQNRISIGAFNIDNKNEIYSLAKELGFNPMYCNNGVRIHNRQLYEYLKNLGDSAWNKYIPKEIKELDKDNLECLLYGLTKGDGHNDHNSISFNLASKQLIEDIGEIGLKTGYTVSYHTNPSYDKYFAKNKKWYTIKESYYVRLSHNKHIRFSKALENIRKREKYNGNVYCVTVPNHTIMIRRNGSTCWIGNCVIVDEAALVDDFTLMDTNRIIGGQAENPDNKLIYSGTPTIYNSLYVAMWEDEKKYPDYFKATEENKNPMMWARYTWAARDCKRFTQGEIDQMKRDLGDEKFAIFWEGKPYPMTNTVVDIKFLRRQSIGYDKFQYIFPSDMTPKIGKIVFGIDWGMTDKTVLIIAWLVDDETSPVKYRYKILECLSWQGQQYDNVHDWITYYASVYKPDYIFVDLNPKGESERSINTLSPKGYYVEAVNMGQYRSTLQTRMKYAFEHEAIFVPQDFVDLLNNIKTYTYDKNKGDDYVTALMLALKDINPMDENFGLYYRVARINKLR